MLSLYKNDNAWLIVKPFRGTPYILSPHKGTYILAFINPKPYLRLGVSICAKTLAAATAARQSANALVGAEPLRLMFCSGFRGFGFMV